MKKRKYCFLLFILIFVPLMHIVAQKFPKVILPGEQLLVKSEIDTLWLLRDSQLKKAIVSGKKLEVAEAINNELHEKVDLLSLKSYQKDSLIIDLKSDRAFYTQKWNECSDDIDLLLRKNRRQKFYTRLSMAGIVVAFIAGILIK